MKEKKARVEDALHATRAAAEEGIIPGGGVAYLRVMNSLDNVATNGDSDEAIGVSIVRKALEFPMRYIAENAGEEGSVVVNHVKADKSGLGFNAISGQYEDLYKAGVIDPTKVARTALENAASISALLITTEALVADKPEKKEAAPAGMPPGGGMGDMGGMY
jgi:chaperonin GroEL